MRLQDKSWVNLILFADKYWLVATSPSMLSDMANEWLRLLGEVGWDTPTADLTWCTTAEDEFKSDIRVNGTNTMRAERKKGFKVLGTMITFDNALDVEGRKSPHEGDKDVQGKLGTVGVRQYPVG